MIDYKECLKWYAKYIRWNRKYGYTDCVKELCNWYQDRCRIYLDENLGQKKLREDYFNITEGYSLLKKMFKDLNYSVQDFYESQIMLRKDKL